jgi:hypothetical protein
MGQDPCGSYGGGTLGGIALSGSLTALAVLKGQAGRKPSAVACIMTLSARPLI